MPTIGKVKAVLFDLGGTLMETVDAPKVHRRILEIYGVKVPFSAIVEVHNANQREHDPEEMARLGQYYWIRWNLRMLEKLGVRENTQFLARKIDELWWEHAELSVYSDVKETLNQLRRKKIKTGIVTNATEKDLEQIFLRIELANYFDVVVGVDACKKAKPNKEIFLFALDKLKVKPEEAIFVGDSVKYDYEGASEAGLKAMLIDRDGKETANIEAITSLNELLKYV